MIRRRPVVMTTTVILQTAEKVAMTGEKVTQAVVKRVAKMKNTDTDGREGDGRDWLRRRKKRESISHSMPKKRRRKSKGRKTSSSRSGDRTSRHRKIRIKIDKYDGLFRVEIFLNKFEDIAEYNAWNEIDKLVHLKASLTGSATHLLTESRGLSYEDMNEK